MSTKHVKCPLLFLANPFILEFLNWTLPALYLVMSIVFNRVVLLKVINKLANSVDPDETAHYEPSHLDLHCLHKYLYRST